MFYRGYFKTLISLLFYFTPCIQRLIGLTKTSKIKDATIGVITGQVKNCVKLSLSSKPEYLPASQPAAEFAKNQIPINKEINFVGESFVTMESPTGDKQSSPIVNIKYAPIIQSIPNLSLHTIDAVSKSA